MTEKSEKKHNAMKIEMESGVKTGFYSNAVKIQHTPLDFRLDFSQVAPDERRISVLARVYFSPIHAKLFMKALEDNVRKYEEQFGEIVIPKQQTGAFAEMRLPSTEKH